MDVYITEDNVQSHTATAGVIAWLTEHALALGLIQVAQNWPWRHLVLAMPMCRREGREIRSARGCPATQQASGQPGICETLSQKANNTYGTYRCQN